MEESAYPMCQHLLEYIKEFDAEWISEENKKKSHIENVHKQMSLQEEIDENEENIGELPV